MSEDKPKKNRFNAESFLIYCKQSPQEILMCKHLGTTGHSIHTTLQRLLAEAEHHYLDLIDPDMFSMLADQCMVEEAVLAHFLDFCTTKFPKW